VAIAITADYANLYVVNQASNNVVHFTIADSGVLTQKDTVTTSPNPSFVQVNTAGTYLYVVSGPRPAVLTAYPLSGGTIGAVAAQVTLSIPNFGGDTVAPTGVTVLANNDAVYVSAFDQSAYNPGGTTTSIANPGWIFGYAVGSNGALTTAVGSPYKAGIKPVAVVSDPTNRFVYTTDFASNQLIGYTIQSGSVLAFMINGPFSAGTEPDALTIDPRGKYIYVSNGLANTVTSFTIDLATGTPSAIVNTTGSQVNSTDTDPVSVAVDAALGRFVYTANYLTLRVEVGCCGDSAARQPLAPVGNAVTKQHKSRDEEPSQSGWAFCCARFLPAVTHFLSQFRSLCREIGTACAVFPLNLPAQRQF
jgi:6-phosphogluconolactonase (cycloisomerase 2 family)